MAELNVGEAYRETIVVTAEQTAAWYGNKGVDVVATPALIGMLEMAAVRFLERHIGADESSVGIVVNVEHLAAAPVGAEVVACVTVSEVDRKRISFDVEASWGDTVLMRGTHWRAVVDLEKFIGSLPKPLK